MQLHGFTLHTHELHTANSSTNKLQCTKGVICLHIRKTYVRLHKIYWKCFTAKRDNLEEDTTTILETTAKWKSLHPTAVTQLLPHLSEDNYVNLWNTLTFRSSIQWLKAQSGHMQEQKPYRCPSRGAKPFLTWALGIGSRCHLKSLHRITESQNGLGWKGPQW